MWICSQRSLPKILRNDSESTKNCGANDRQVQYELVVVVGRVLDFVTEKSSGTKFKVS